MAMPTTTALATLDSLRWALTSSVIAHLFLVLGISFVMPKNDRPVFSPPLKITLVAPNPNQDQPNPSARTLAQINSRGEPDSRSQQQQMQLRQLPGRPHRSQSQAPLTQVESAYQTHSRPPLPDRQQLTDAIDLAYLDAQQQPREKFVSSEAQASIFTAYIEKWRLKVETIGNLNYPDAAKQSNLEGALILDVTLLSNGNIDAIKLLRSSGHKILDDSARRIVYLSAPFATFSREMRQTTDKLHIIRTWRFGKNHVLYSTPVDAIELAD